MRTGDKKAQATLGVKFPPAFLHLVCKFDLGESEVCNVRFGVGGNYADELVRLNCTDEYGGKWWPGESRPANLIVFTVGDPWIFLLDCADGAIYAWLLGDEGLCGRRVASDFERFFRALAGIGVQAKRPCLAQKKSLNLSRQAMIRRLSFGEKRPGFNKFNSQTIGFLR